MGHPPGLQIIRRQSIRCKYFGALLLLLSIIGLPVPASACITPGLLSAKNDYYNKRAVTLSFSFAEDCRDAVNIRWAAPAGSWKQIEFSPFNSDFGSCIPYNRMCQANMTRAVGADVDKPYLFKIQSCRTRTLATSVCIDWSQLGKYLPSGIDTCIDGFVWREASASDHVCVAPTSRNDAQADNAAALSRVSPTDHSFGPQTCLQGFVWREAFAGDTACVAAATRTRSKQENDDNWRNLARNWS